MQVVRINGTAVVNDFAAAGEIAGDGDRSVFRAAAADDDASCDGRNRFARIGVKDAADERIRNRFSRQDFGDEVPDGGRSVAFGRQAGISGRAELNRVRQRIAAGLCAGERDGCCGCRRKRSFVPVFRFRFRRRRGDGCRRFGIAGGGVPGIAVGGAGALCCAFAESLREFSGNAAACCAAAGSSSVSAENCPVDCLTSVSCKLV